MFKLESYLTPVLLNYVGKYVKNFKAEQSQVSLWGGDATFQNLDLRLGVLNQQFDLPFTFISGHIHELLIHVPWVKITSEPIVITINTIECILKMKDGSETDDEGNFNQRSTVDSLQDDVSSGYINSIVTKVVNNITINCNNLILKFVEEDIVLSVNIRFLSMQTVNEEWRPTFIDINASDMILRKVVTIEDLTLCLDRLDSSGKIDIYQDPVVYRCSMTIRWIMNYQNNTGKRTSITRFDLHSEKMEFSITEQQIPMILRLITLLLTSQSKRTMADGKSTTSSEEIDNIEEHNANYLMNNNQGWSSWAWNTLSSFVPVDWSNDPIDDHLKRAIQTVHIGIYIDDAILTFKTTETAQETFSHKSVRVRYRPFLTLQFSSVVASIIMQGMKSTVIQFGLATVGLYPRGSCSCGHPEVKSNVVATPYISLGKVKSTNYLASSLFDPDSDENGGKILYYHEIFFSGLSATTNLNNLLQKCPAFVMDYVHCVELPEGIAEEELLKYNGNFEFSNFKEIDRTHYVIGDLTLRICSGILHRLNAIIRAIESDIIPGDGEKSELTVTELPPVTVEEYEALNEYIPIVETRLTVRKLVIHMQVTDHHRDFGMIISDEGGRIYKTKFPDYPRLDIQVDEIICNKVSPMYAFRLVACASQQGEQLRREMLELCYTRFDMKCLGFNSKVQLAENCQMQLIMPCNFNGSANWLLYPQYWTIPHVTHIAHDLKIDSLTITTTNAKLKVVYSILTSIFLPTTITSNGLINSSLLHDACNEKRVVHLELSCESINYSNSVTTAMISKTINVNSMRIFALNGTQQAFVLSGPEYLQSDGETKLFSCILQIPCDIDIQSGPLIATFKLSETRASIDPLLLDWLNYQSVNYDCNQLCMCSDTRGTEETSSDTSTRKKFPSLHENVHSPSEKERKWTTLGWIRDANRVEDMNKSSLIVAGTESSLFSKFINYYHILKQLTISGTIEPLVIYIPEMTMDGVGADGIEQAKDRAREQNDSCNIIVIKTSQMIIRSASLTDDQTSHDDPTTQTNKITSNHLPWVMDFTEFRCYTLIKQKILNFFIIESLNATIDATVKPNVNNEKSENNSNTLGFCIYIDTSPIIVSCSLEQLQLIERLSTNIWRIFARSMMINNNNINNNLRDDRTEVPIQSQTPLSPIQLLCTDTDTTSSTSTSKNDGDLEMFNGALITMTAWIQWTIAKIAIKLFTDDSRNEVESKLVIVFEDIITSVDWQPVYMQMKNKITTAVIYHYERPYDQQIWTLGDYTGCIMCSREENLEKIKESDFFNVTITRARSNNVYTKWRGHKQQKLPKDNHFTDATMSVTNYITEMVIKMQMIEIILPIFVLQRFSFILSLCANTKQQNNNNTTESSKLPLVYLDFQGLTLVILLNSSLSTNHYHHDAIILKTDSITVVPHAENPICRVILRPDLYELAAQANILNTPGSAVEDRQYQIKINGICVLSTTWKNYELTISRRKSQSLYTMNENPALEWNKLGNSGIDQQSACSQLISRCDLCCIIAPPMFYKSDTIICGSAIEVTFLTDIEVMMSLEQIHLLSTFQQHLRDLNLNKHDADTRINNTEYENLPPSTACRMAKSTRVESIQESVHDSGVDIGMSSTDLASHGHLTKASRSKIPYEYLINCGKILMTFYETTIVDDDQMNSTVPLVLFTINQPNAYISQQNSTNIIRINCFDVSVMFSDDKNTTELNNYLIQTKSGDPHPNTGIPPSFLIIQWEKSHEKCRITVEMGRPTKLNLSTTIILKIQEIKEKILNCFVGESTEAGQAMSLHNWIVRDKQINVPDIDLMTKQIVVMFQMISGQEMIASLAAFNADISSRQRRVHSTVSIISLMMTTSIYGSLRTLLNPMSCNIITNIIWESWQDIEDVPLLRIQIISDRIYFNISSHQIRVIQNLMNNLDELLSLALDDEKIEQGEINSSAPSTEQHYQDDLKAGAFQFADGLYEQLPLPYQAVFYSSPRQIMAWRYPQPRILTRLSVTEVLYEIMDDVDVDLNDIHCVIEYWNENLMAYQSYIEFSLGEHDEDDDSPKLSNKISTRAVACLWRAVIYSSDNEDCPVSARDLAGCLRIDSYFNSSLIPNVELTLNTQIIELSLFNHINVEVYKNLPKPLDKFKLNNVIPENTIFATINAKNVILVVNRWHDNALLMDITSTLDISILDHGTMVIEELLEPLENKVQLSIEEETINLNLICKEFWLKFGPEIARTLTLSLTIWSTVFDNTPENAVIFTGLVIANDSNTPIRFGQCCTTDDMMLNSRECHFYSWRYGYDEKIRIAVENNGWSWSRPFKVSKIGTKPVIFDNYNAQINVTVKSLSATQKLILFSGQIIISNELLDDFELKLVRYNHESDRRIIISEDILYIARHSRPASLVVTDDRKNMAMRLKFGNLSYSAWTGDIPLHANAKCDQPWLVKVPTQEKSQFLSIWVRICREIVNDSKRILVVLSPLYMIQSWLPKSMEIHVETPMLQGATFLTTVAGCGNRQQIYCPGTFEHFHQITFPSTCVISTRTSACCPLSYNHIDQRTFFKRPDTENVDVILEQLDGQRKTQIWPFLNEDLNNWTPVEQSQTHIQVRYRDAGLVSSTLLLEIRPWCFILNSFGQTIRLVTPENNIISEIPHTGIVAPPKIEGIFHIELMTINKETFKSSSLQLAHTEGNRGFIMPQISGLISLDGTTKSFINCGNTTAVLLINSSIHEESRILRINSSHIVCNFSDFTLKIAPIIIDTKSSNITLPLVLKSLTISPCKTDKTGIPIVEWQNLLNNDINENHCNFFISLSIDVDEKNNINHWSRPIKVNQSIGRDSVALPNGTTTIPIIVTTQRDGDVIYITIIEDQHPQLFVKNSCHIPMTIGQANTTGDAIDPDTPPFMWSCRIQSGESSHYAMKSVGCRVPDTFGDKETTHLLLLTASTRPDDKAKSVNWVKVIELPTVKPIKLDQFVYVDGYSDVKITAESQGHTTYIHLQPKSQAEISVSDIRSRLMSEGTNNHDNKCCITNSNAITTEQLSTLQSAIINKENNLTKDTVESDRKVRIKHLTIYFHRLNLIITQDSDDSRKKIEVAGFYLTNTIVSVITTMKILTIKMLIGDLQLDNQMFDYGGFDFPVVLISQKPSVNDKTSLKYLFSLENTIKEIAKNSLVLIEVNWDKVNDVLACKDVHVKIAPINIYIEDKFVTQLLEYVTAIVRPCLLIPLDQSIESNSVKHNESHELYVKIPANIIMDARIISSPLQLHRLTIEPLSILLSVHTSVRLYVALDHSPLYFGSFERHNLFTTPYRLGNALTMHYLSGAIFGAGWVVGSLEILGSPGSFAQALGSGIKDFIALPFQGLLQGPWGFIVGITHGSASLMKNITAGTVNSVTKLASSVARNLDRLTLDEEHLQRQEESRRVRPQGMVQGLYQGLTGFGISILAAVAGLAHHPLQHAWSGDATTRGLVTGVGLGLVGVVTKPLSGAAELVALTGQGLLHRTGWNSLPLSRRSPNLNTNKPINMSNRYVWKLMPYLMKNHDSILHLIDGIFVNDSNDIPVTMVLTRQNFLIINNLEDSVDKIYPLRELMCQIDSTDISMFKLTWPVVLKQKERKGWTEKSEMDEEMRSRVEQFVLNSNTGLTASLSVDSDIQSSGSQTTAVHTANTMVFLIDANQRNYLMAIMKIVKRQSQGIDFPVL